LGELSRLARGRLAVAFLASELAAWITGQTLSISGGYTTI
jgi:NAD(P)-dependent dehydrogenase (short-subunit alcohol dehydrogenase family)